MRNTLNWDKETLVLSLPESSLPYGENIQLLPNARKWYERNAAIVVEKRGQSKKAKDACVTITVFLKIKQISMWCHM